MSTTPLHHLKSRESLALFLETLDSFVFFHLGSDAVVEFEEQGEGLRISIQHSRVFPFQFEVSEKQLAEMNVDTGQFEDLFLDLLTRHRRHR